MHFAHVHFRDETRNTLFHEENSKVHSSWPSFCFDLCAMSEGFLSDTGQNRFHLKGLSMCAVWIKKQSLVD